MMVLRVALVATATIVSSGGEERDVGHVTKPVFVLGPRVEQNTPASNIFTS